MESIERSTPLPHDSLRKSIWDSLVWPLRLRFYELMDGWREQVSPSKMLAYYGTAFHESDRGKLLKV